MMLKETTNQSTNNNAFCMDLLDETETRRTGLALEVLNCT